VDDSEVYEAIACCPVCHLQLTTDDPVAVLFDRAVRFIAEAIEDDPKAGLAFGPRGPVYHGRRARLQNARARQRQRRLGGIRA
jgi:hypothetical protein